MHSAEYLDTLPPLPIKNKEKMNLYNVHVPFGLYIFFIHKVSFIKYVCNEKTKEMKIQKEKV